MLAQRNVASTNVATKGETTTTTRGDAKNAAEHQPAPAFALADVTYRGDEAEHAVGKGERAEDQRERQKRFRGHDEG